MCIYVIVCIFYVTKESDAHVYVCVCVCACVHVCVRERLSFMQTRYMNKMLTLKDLN